LGKGAAGRGSANKSENSSLINISLTPLLQKIGHEAADPGKFVPCTGKEMSLTGGLLLFFVPIIALHLRKRE